MKKPIDDRTTPAELMGNNNELHKRSAEEALKAAKLMEKQRKAQGFSYVRGPNRSWVLKKD